MFVTAIHQRALRMEPVIHLIHVLALLDGQMQDVTCLYATDLLKMLHRYALLTMVLVWLQTLAYVILGILEVTAKYPLAMVLQPMIPEYVAMQMVPA